MSAARVTSAVTVSALVRLCQQQGGFAAVLAKGDPTSGAILLVMAERGRTVAAFERILQPDGTYGWRQSLSGQQESDQVAGFIDRSRRFDPDLWVVELDVASVERFTAELKALD